MINFQKSSPQWPELAETRHNYAKPRNLPSTAASKRGVRYGGTVTSNGSQLNIRPKPPPPAVSQQRPPIRMSPLMMPPPLSLGVVKEEIVSATPKPKPQPQPSPAVMNSTVRTEEISSTMSRTSSTSSIQSISKSDQKSSTVAKVSLNFYHFF